jgi:hypothetical protein
VTDEQITYERALLWLDEHLEQNVEVVVQVESNKGPGARVFDVAESSSTGSSERRFSACRGTISSGSTQSAATT